MYRRFIGSRIAAALEDTPVVLLNGARQTGKTTLLRKLTGSSSRRYFTLDDAVTLAAAKEDPQAFVDRGDGLLAIDEIQKAPELLPAIKLAVDRDRRPGRFLLSGSAQVLLLPTVSESLAGRIEVLTLWPLSHGEIAGAREGFLQAAFAPTPDQLASLACGEGPEREHLIVDVTRGGFPESIARRSESRRQAWFASYISTILQRDVRDLSRIEGLSQMPRLLQLLAARTGGLLNKSDLARDAALAYSSLDRYLSLLEWVFLYQPLIAWSGNLGKRLVKAPKVHLLDTGLAAHLLGASVARLREDPTAFGHLLESYVVGELRKQASFAPDRVNLLYVRTHARKELDLVLEDRAGRLVAIEVKARATLRPMDLRSMRSWGEDLGVRLHRGIVLYTGTDHVPFGDRFDALSLRALSAATSPGSAAADG